MNRIIFICIGVIATVFLSGCQGQQKAVNDPNMQVVLIGTDHFPKEFSGTWWNKQYGWVLNFERNGRLSEITHYFGRLSVKAGQEANIPLKGNGKAQVVPGVWYVQYAAKDKELTVEINLKSYTIEIAGNTIKGSSRDIFAGTISEEGKKIWLANWVSFPENSVSTANHMYDQYRLPVGEDQIDQGILEFEKVNPKDIQ